MFGCVCAVYAVHHLIGEVWPAAKANYGRESQRKHEQERHRKKVTRFSGYLRINTEKMYYRMDVKVFICTFSNMPWQSCKGWGGGRKLHTHSGGFCWHRGTHKWSVDWKQICAPERVVDALTISSPPPPHTEREKIKSAEGHIGNSQYKKLNNNLMIPKWLFDGNAKLKSNRNKRANRKKNCQAKQ